MNLRKNTMLAASVMALVLTSGAFAAGDHHQHTAAATVATAASATLTAGEVRKVDVEQGKVTIRHEPIANLEMPAMTMVFRAEKPELLRNLKVGDKIRFHAESVDGSLVVTQMEAAK